MGEAVRTAVKASETKKDSQVSQVQLGIFYQPVSSPVEEILFLQRTIGNQAVQKLMKSGALQAKLMIGAPGDVYEQEADRVADAVMRMPQPRALSSVSLSIRRACPKCEVDELKRQPIKEEDEEEKLQRKPIKEEEEELQAKAISGSIPEVNPDIESHIQSVTGGGKPLSENERAFFELRFGQDFSQVRLHIGAQAAESARMVNAKAFTIGQDIVFGEGQYDPASKSGKYLLAHELVHTVQQGKGIQRQIQLTRLGIYSDSSQWQNDPAKISDTDLKATDEFTWLDTMYGSGWRVPLKSFTESEILLALRLIIRYMHAQSVTLSQDQAAFQSFAIPYLERAHSQSGAAGQAEALAGQLNWTALGPPDFSNPATAKSAFTRWLLVPNTPEPTDTSTMNCWELALYSAYRGGFTTKTHLQAIYTSAAAQTGMGVPREIERLVCGSRFTFDLTNPQSREPIRGDIVIFNEFAGHVAISLGTKTASGQHEVMSLWSVPSQSGNRVFRTTIETLAGTMTLTSVNFCTPNW